MVTVAKVVPAVTGAPVVTVESGESAASGDCGKQW
jgi:hypothetical protein